MRDVPADVIVALALAAGMAVFACDPPPPRPQEAAAACADAYAGLRRAGCANAGTEAEYVTACRMAVEDGLGLARRLPCVSAARAPADVRACGQECTTTP